MTLKLSRYADIALGFVLCLGSLELFIYYLLWDYSGIGVCIDMARILYSFTIYKKDAINCERTNFSVIWQV